MTFTGIRKHKGMGNLLYLNIVKEKERLLYHCLIAGERDLNDIPNTEKNKLTAIKIDSTKVE